MIQKRLLLLCLLSLLAMPPAWASLLVEEPFNYPDGPLTALAGRPWATHGGESNQIQITAGRMILTQASTEDANILLPGGPYRGGALYAGFHVNFSSLPTGAGAYFAHFKDGTGTGFRGRVFATTNGATRGTWRAGVASGAGSPVYIPADLDLAVDYLLLLRYDSGTGASTLWLNPAAETTQANRAEAADSTTVLNIVSFGVREVVAAGSGMGTLAFDRLRIGTNFVEVLEQFDPRRDPPALSAIPDQNIPANTSTPAVPILIHDGETAAANLLLSASSDNPGLVGVAGVAFGGGGSNRTVRVTPTPGRQGLARLTVTVTDADGNTAHGTFQVTVGVPTLSSLADQITPHDTAAGPIGFRVGDAESDPLTLRVFSTNTTLLPVANTSLSGQGSNRFLTLQPAAGVTGLSEITVALTDGFNTVSNSFLLTVHPTRGLVLNEPFDYPDGSVISNAPARWSTHSAGVGQTGQTQVVQSRLALGGGQGEDLHALLPGGPYPSAEAWVLFSRFTLRFTQRPSGGGDYVAHYRGASSGAGARLFALATGASAGKFRLGLANTAASPTAVFPLDLETNVPYSVITRFNTATGQATLWVNSTSDLDPGLSAFDDSSPLGVASYAFRQSAGIGTFTVDDLQIGTRWSDLQGHRLIIDRGAAEVTVRWPVAAETEGYHLEGSATGQGSRWQTIAGTPVRSGDLLSLRLPAAQGHYFFRLSH